MSQKKQKTIRFSNSTIKTANKFRNRGEHDNFLRGALSQLLNDIEQCPPETQHQIEDFIAFIKTCYQSVGGNRQPEITKGDKSINPSDLFGLWAEQPRNLTDIRKQAWQRSESE